MIFDIIVFAAILMSCLIAFLRGFIREVLTILGVIGGTAASVALGPQLTPIVRGWLGHTAENPDKAAEDAGKAGEKAAEHADRLFGVIPYDQAAQLLAYGAVFVVVVIVLSIVSHIVSGAARKLGLGMIDRTLGVIFGAVRAVLMLALLYLPVYLLADEATRNQWFEGSHARVYVEATSQWIAGFLPKSMSDDTKKPADRSSISFASSTRERLEQLDLLKDALRKKTGEAADTIKDKGEEAGEAIEEKTDTARERLHDAGEALRGQPVYKSGGSAQPSYDSLQRGGMDDLIRKENDAPAPKTRTGAGP